MPSAGPLLVVLGLAIALLGVLIWTGALSWFGRLPGDVRLEGESVRVYIPITSMILVSIALTGIAWLARRWFSPGD
ncbi:MAG TPA: DUF2905 domain-containing protein [Planctomycetota bacterium]|nr:DUF2905 domain-containing protein [Planctomycetota bacterium]